MNSKKQFLTIAIVGIVAFLGFFMFINQYLRGSQALISSADVQILPKTGKIPTTPVTFIVKPQIPTEKVSGVDLRVEVENGTLLSWGDCDTVGTSNPSIFSNLVATTDQAKGRKSCIVLKNDQDLPTAVAVTANIACKNSSSVTIKVDKTNTQIVGNVQGFAYAVNSDTAVLDCADATGLTGTPAPTGGPTITPVAEDLIAGFTPNDCQAEVGKSCTYQFNLKAQNSANKISGYYAKFTYDPKVIKGKSITAADVKGMTTSKLIAQSTAITPPLNTVTGSVTPINPIGISCTSDADCQKICTAAGKPICPLYCDLKSGTGKCAATGQNPNPSGTLPPVTPGTTGTPGNGGVGCTVVSAKNSPEKGEMEILFACDKSASTLPSQHSATLVLDGVANGQGDLTIQSIQAFGPQKAAGYSIFKNKATYTIGEAPVGGAGNVQLDMKLRFQCIQSKPKNRDTMKVKVGLDGNGQTKKYATGEFKVDDKGIWSGTVAFNVPAGSGYRLYPKGSMHMQKRICANNPGENYPGAYRCDKGAIELKDGKNTVDFSKVILLTGDLPEQDGISNSYDQSLIRNLLGKDTEECKKNADINGDGVCNALDHSCMISALQIRWDDE